MDRNENYIEDIDNFINDTRQGKYSDLSCVIQVPLELRCDYGIIENEDGVVDNVMLYGLTC